MPMPSPQTRNAIKKYQSKYVMYINVKIDETPAQTLIHVRLKIGLNCLKANWNETLSQE